MVVSSQEKIRIKDSELYDYFTYSLSNTGAGTSFPIPLNLLAGRIRQEYNYFVEKLKALLGFRGKGRKIGRGEGGYQPRETPAVYNAFLVMDIEATRSLPDRLTISTDGTGITRSIIMFRATRPPRCPGYGKHLNPKEVVMRYFRIVCALVAICAIGCTTPGKRSESIFEQDIDAILATNLGLINNTPIIDIHTHTFNAKYLPLLGIVLGKRDVSLLTMLFHSRSVRPVAQAIAAEAKLTEIKDPDPTVAGAPPGLSFQQIKKEIAKQQQISPQMVEQNNAVRALGKVINEYENEIEKRKDVKTPRLRDEKSAYLIRQMALDKSLKAMEEADLKAIRDALQTFGFVLEIDAVDRFLRALISPDGDQYRNYMRSYGGRAALIVSHMMDLAPVYDQKEGTDQLIDFEDEQIPRMAAFQELEDSGMIYFAAYNPFRDNWKKGNPEPGRSLKIVKDAIDKYGAYGVKVYPPSGYRPINNQIPSPPTALFTKHPGRQWQARYEGVTGKALDRRLKDLLVWCEENDIPVFAHCSTGEFEARKGYGVAMAHPGYWRDYLEARSEEIGRASRLRLCLGHAGGPAFWFGDHKDRKWGEIVVALCRKYPNVYCEIGAHEQITDKKKREYFIALLNERFEVPTSAEFPFRLADKMMYGTDWFMPGKVFPQIDYLLGYQLALLDPRILPYYRKFFFENALDYLAVAERIGRTDYPLTPAIRERLRLLLGQR